MICASFLHPLNFHLSWIYRKPFYWNNCVRHFHAVSVLPQDFFPEQKPYGGKCNLVGVWSWALSNKGNYRRLFRLMDPTEDWDSPFLQQNRVLLLRKLRHILSSAPHALDDLTLLQLKKRHPFCNVRPLCKANVWRWTSAMITGCW